MYRAGAVAHRSRGPSEKSDLFPSFLIHFGEICDKPRAHVKPLANGKFITIKHSNVDRLPIRPQCPK
jgi:hypothetical protein